MEMVLCGNLRLQAQVRQRTRDTFSKCISLLVMKWARREGSVGVKWAGRRDLEQPADPKPQGMWRIKGA